MKKAVSIDPPPKLNKNMRAKNTIIPPKIFAINTNTQLSISFPPLTKIPYFNFKLLHVDFKEQFFLNDVLFS